MTPILLFQDTIFGNRVFSMFLQQIRSIPQNTWFLIFCYNNYKINNQRNSLFQEEISACAAVHRHHVMDVCNCAQSIILLSPMIGMSFMLVVLSRLIVSEPKQWVTWSQRTDVNFPFLMEKRIQYFSVSA